VANNTENARTISITAPELEWLRISLAGAATALPVLFTMLTKAGLREGATVADEINANVITANRELQHILSRLSREDIDRARHEAKSEAELHLTLDDKITRDLSSGDRNE
jgi:hypothetical protein